ncbi:MAG: flagellin [Alphaproteobacteria bacterium]
MPLNVVSNYAANVAHRNLQINDTAASNSLGKLSTGKRVVNARDDAASMAIGQRLNSEVMGLKQAVVNSGQANSMLQIADGAMSTASDILTRMKVLAIQSSSGNLSSTERDFLDTEYQALFNEIDRIADDTDFAGTKLLDGAIEITAASGFEVADGVASITAQGIDDGGGTTAAQFSISFDYDSTANTAAFYITTAEGSYSGAINTEALGTDGALTRATTVTVEGSGTAPAPGSFTIALNTAFDSTTSIAAATDGEYSGSSELSLTFKLGTGTESQDSLTFSVDAINTASLGLTGTTIDTEETAAAALEAVNTAIDNLNESRSDVGAAQNRLDFASANLNISVENAEAARSTLVDLDIAQEMTKFSSKQVLMQAGVAMLAQANQMPQNLLRLLN